MPQSNDSSAPVRWRAFGVIWLLVLAWCTLRSAPAQAAEVQQLRWYCIVCGDSGGADILLNVLLFMPLGLTAHALGWRFRNTVLLLMALSIAIEVTQGTLLVGRDASLGDVCSNTAGSLLGWLGFPTIAALVHPSVRFARRGVSVVLLVMTMTWWVTGAALRPALSSKAPWYGQPIHSSPGDQPFPGSLQRVTFDGFAVPNEELYRLPPWRDSIRIEIDATRNTDQRFTRGISMLKIVDSAGRLQAAVDQIGDDARLRLRLRADAWHLHSTRWLIPHGLNMAVGVGWQFRWSWFNDHIDLSSAPVAGPAAPPKSVPFSIGLGWAFIHPFVATVGANRLLWTTLWLGFWFGLLGWLAGITGIRGTCLVGAGAVGLFVGASLCYGLRLRSTELLAAATAYAIAAIASTWRRPAASFVA